MQGILQKIEAIDPSNDFLKFITKRVVRDDYRGLQLSQHNRYTLNDVKIILEALLEVSNGDLLQIRDEDLKRRPYNLPGEQKYANLVNIISKKLARTTQDSLRKNLFVDFHRMGLIERYGIDRIMLDSYSRKHVKYVKISAFGQLLINSKTFFQSYLIYTEALNSLLKDLISDLFTIIARLKNNKLTSEEFMYIVTFLNKDIEHTFYNVEKIIGLIEDYRRLPKISRALLKELLQTFCDPTKPSRSKTEKRDYHNWKNESQQILSLLNQTAYFSYSKEELMPKIQKSEDAAFDTLEKFIRSAAVKAEYFDKHKIKNEKGFELHHIIPVSMATTKEEFSLIDDWKNLIYIDGFNHSKLTQLGSTHYKLEANDKDLILLNALENQIYLKYNQNVLYNVIYLKTMLDYNLNLRQSI